MKRTSATAVMVSLLVVLVRVGHAVYVETNTCTCGKYTPRKGRIVGGLMARMHEFPMMSALVDGMQGRLYCGATIISELYAVTAAHCTINRIVGSVALLVGDHDISSNRDTKTAKLIMVERFIVHPDYDFDTQFNDIALVQLNSKIKLNRSVWPACLPFRHHDSSFARENVTVLGWGSTEFGGPTSSKLLKTTLGILTNEECREAYNGTTCPLQICSYAPDTDACQTDSGGPLLWSDVNNSKRWLTLVGIVSYGVSCATSMPGVNTRVTAYLEWIVRSTPGMIYCNLSI